MSRRRSERRAAQRAAGGRSAPPAPFAVGDHERLGQILRVVVATDPRPGRVIVGLERREPDARGVLQPTGVLMTAWLAPNEAATQARETGAERCAARVLQAPPLGAFWGLIITVNARRRFDTSTFCIGGQLSPGGTA
jgi:hypothetical protein